MNVTDYNIAVRMEGGAGDHLLANRFVFAIKEKYVGAKINLFSDTEGKTFQTELLQLLYPNVYNSITVIPAKVRKPFMVQNQFGKEDYVGHYSNIPEEYRNQMAAQDNFYDLHIDSLRFTEYDFDWKRYFRFFPTPNDKNDDHFKRGAYITVHLRSTNNRANDLQDWYIANLLERLVRIMPVRIIAQEEDISAYTAKFGVIPEGCKFVVGNSKEVVSVIAHSKFFLGVDSGFTYVAYAYDVPTLTFNAFCQSPHQVAPHQIIRWTVFPERILPLNYDAAWVVKKVKAIIDSPGLAVLPYLDNFDIQAVKRNNTIL